MIFLIILFLIFVILLSVIVFYNRKFFDPFTSTLVVGKKGSGKSLYIAKMAMKYQGRKFTFYDDHLKKFIHPTWQVITNSKDIKVPGILYFDHPELIGKKGFPPYSLVILDEVSLIDGFDNRDFRKDNKHVSDFFRMLRHAKCRMILVSQTFDLDKKIRKNMDGLYLIKSLGFLIVVRKIEKFLDINENSMQDADSQLIDRLRFTPIFKSGALQLIWTDRWIKYNSSYSEYVLPCFETYSAPDQAQLR